MRVVVTGMGVVTPVGRSVETMFDALVNVRSGISTVPAAMQNAAGLLVAGQVTATSAPSPPRGGGSVGASVDRATEFALDAAAQAVSDAGLTLSDEESFDAGVYWGTGLGGATSIEESYRQLFAGHGRIRPTAVVLGMSNAAAGHLSIAHGLRGPLVNVSTACASSATSIGEAYRAILHGHASVIVAGGSEALLTAGNLRAWDAMQALAHGDPKAAPRSCKPFSANRSGIVLGEGAAALVLERSDRAEARGATIYAEVAGYGATADARGMSKPDAGGQSRAMRAALAEAGMSVDGVQYLNAHGTATPVGDVVETDAIRRTFGAAADHLPVSSTKALHGHLMGATGAVELIVAIMAMRQGVLPPTAHLDVPDPACDLDYVPNEARAARIDAVMSNSFGFGGVNAVLVARRHRPRAA